MSYPLTAYSQTRYWPAKGSPASNGEIKMR